MVLVDRAAEAGPRLWGFICGFLEDHWPDSQLAMLMLLMLILGVAISMVVVLIFVMLVLIGGGMQARSIHRLGSGARSPTV